MKNIDVLIIYEHKTRELENCALLAAELTRRNLKVEVLYMYSMPKRWNIKAKVIMTPHLYNDDQLSFFILNNNNSNRIIIDLQYEQVLSESSEDGIHNPSGKAMKAHHIAWGKAQTDRYLKHGIERQYIKELGCISMDLFRPEFSSFFLSRKQLSTEFNLDESKEWVLFISSFSYANRSKEEIRHLSKLNPNASSFAEISNKSYNIILSWFENAIQKHPNKEFIYRKHPSEINNNHLFILEQKYDNFHCIDSYSMRQWTIIVDTIYNWFSTSLADVYFANKSCFILRPIEIPSRMDVSIMSDGIFINNKKQFLKSLNKKKYPFPVSSKKIEHFYNNSRHGKMAFQKTADLCEDLILKFDSTNPFEIKIPKRGGYFFVKFLYDFIMYEYGIRFKTPKIVITIMNYIPPLRKTAFKLALFNKDLYDTKKTYKQYYLKFKTILNTISHEI